MATIFELVPESIAIFSMVTRGLPTEADRIQGARKFWGTISHYTENHQPGDDAVAADRRQAEQPELHVDEAHVETDVVPDDDGVADELLQRREDCLDAGCLGDHGMRDAGEHGDAGGDGPSRIDQCGQRAEALAAADLDRADLGDRARRRAPAGGFQVDDDERDLRQGGAQLVERALDRAAVGAGRNRLRRRGRAVCHLHGPDRRWGVRQPSARRAVLPARRALSVGAPSVPSARRGAVGFAGRRRTTTAPPLQPLTTQDASLTHLECFDCPRRCRFQV